MDHDLWIMIFTRVMKQDLYQYCTLTHIVWLLNYHVDEAILEHE